MATGRPFFAGPTPHIIERKPPVHGISGPPTGSRGVSAGLPTKATGRPAKVVKAKKDPKAIAAARARAKLTSGFKKAKDIHGKLSDLSALGGGSVRPAQRRVSAAEEASRAHLENLRAQGLL